jgi:hypothetical protein
VNCLSKKIGRCENVIAFLINDTFLFIAKQVFLLK